MNIAYTKGHKTKETNYAKTITKHKAKEHEFWRLHKDLVLYRMFIKVSFIFMMHSKKL